MSYPKKAWVENTPVGGVKGGNFEIVASAGAVVKSIRVYYRMDKNDVAWLRGIEVKFSDGESGKTGTCDDSKFEEYNFDAEKVETVTSMSLQGMGTGEWDQVRKMEFSTAKNKPFSVGWPKKKDQQVYKMDVGSGILIGFMGASGTEIDRIAPIFLKPVKQMYIDKVEYPTLDLKKTDFLQIQSLARGRAEYNGASYKYTLIGEESVSTATTWNQKFTMELGTEIMWKGNLIVASEEIKLSLKLGGQFDRGGSTSKSRLLRWNFEKQINGPYDTIECLATYWSGTLDLEYKGTLNIVLKDGEHFGIPTEGSISQVVCSNTVQTVRPLDGNPLFDENRELQDSDEGNGSIEPQTEDENRDLEEEAGESEQIEPEFPEDGEVQLAENGEPLATEPGTRYDENGSWIGDEPETVQETFGGEEDATEGDAGGVWQETDENEVAESAERSGGQEEEYREDEYREEEYREEGQEVTEPQEGDQEDTQEVEERNQEEAHESEYQKEVQEFEERNQEEAQESEYQEEVQEVEEWNQEEAQESGYQEEVQEEATEEGQGETPEGYQEEEYQARIWTEQAENQATEEYDETPQYQRDW